MNKEDVINEIKDHISKVSENVNKFIDILKYRATGHDASKLEEPELDIFVKYTPLLKSTTYMSNEYKEYLKEMKPALDHHYSVNPHHPEFHENGILDMSLFDIIEMLMDWKAAVERHEDGNIYKSLEINAKRFSIPKELLPIFEKTIRMMSTIYLSINKIDSENTFHTEFYAESFSQLYEQMDSDLRIEEEDYIFIMKALKYMLDENMCHYRAVNDNLIIEWYLNW